MDDFASHAALTDERGAPIKLKITGHAQGMAIVTVEGVTSRNEAELLRGRKIGVARTAMPALEKPNTYYIDDLVGMSVVDAAGAAFGTVTNLFNFGAGDILEINRPDHSKELYAFTHTTFPEVNLSTREIIISPPEIV
jgi:16S rRNA processing protein RimM